MLFYKFFSKQKLNKAFSLIELSIVILIVSILITGVLSVSTTGVNNAKIKITRERMEAVYKALGNFVLKNGRLPCPAGIKRIRDSDGNYGNEESCADNTTVGVYQCNQVSFNRLYYGAVPVNALGIPTEMAEDGFGSKFAYIVHDNYTVSGGYPSSVASGSFSLPDPTYDSHRIQLFEQPANFQASDEGIVAVISYGANKYGAFNATSASQNSRSPDSDERGNDINFDVGFNYDSTIYSTSTASDEFDDIVLFKTRDNFVTDFDAMTFIACEDAGVDFGVNVHAYYGQIVYATSSCPSPNEDKRLTRKCGPYGQWVDIVASCP